MPTARNIFELAEYLKGIRSATEKAAAIAQLKMSVEIEKEAKDNFRKQFGHTGSGYVLTGAMLNAIYSDLDFRAKGKIPDIIAGTRGIPYGAVHEFGGKIKPKNANHLWVKNYSHGIGRFKRMTPREFMEAKRDQPRNFRIFRNPNTGKLIAAYVEKLRDVKMKTTDAASKVVTLFSLKDEVTIPERPYIRPAVKKVLTRSLVIYGKTLEQVFRG